MQLTKKILIFFTIFNFIALHAMEYEYPWMKEAEEQIPQAPTTPALNDIFSIYTLPTTAYTLPTTAEQATSTMVLQEPQVVDSENEEILPVEDENETINKITKKRKGRGPVLPYEKNEDGEYCCKADKEKCSRKFLTQYLVKAHIKVFHSNELQELRKKRADTKCGICGSELDSPSDKKRHEKACEKKAKGYRCDICCKDFKQASAFATHNLIHRSFTCRKKSCFRSYTEEAKRDAHEKTCNAEIFVTCHICGLVSSSKPTHVEHEKEHLNLPERTFKCKYKDCGQSFTRDALEQHTLEHQNANPTFKCPLCKKKILERKREEHQNDHNNDEFFTCRVCNTVIKGKKNLSSHEGTKKHIKNLQNYLDLRALEN